MCDHHPFLVRGPFRWQNKRNLFIGINLFHTGSPYSFNHAKTQVQWRSKLSCREWRGGSQGLFKVGFIFRCILFLFFLLKQPFLLSVSAYVLSVSNSTSVKFKCPGGWSRNSWRLNRWIIHHFIRHKVTPRSLDVPFMPFFFCFILGFITWLCFSFRKVTEFIEGGDLQQLWQETGCFHEDLIKIYVAEIALVLGSKWGDSELQSIKIISQAFLQQISFTTPALFTEIWKWKIFWSTAMDI